MDQKNTLSRDIWETIITNLLGWGLAIGIILIAWSSQSKTGLQPASSPTSLPSTAFVPTMSVPTMFVPKPDCGTPTLVIGGTTFQIQQVQTAPDGSLTVPSDTSDVAYWVNGTNTNYVFVLSPTPDSLALQTALTTGDMATVFLGDCTTVSFNISVIGASQLTDPALLDQSSPGISVFVQTDPSTAGFLIKGSPAEETVSVIDTPIPDESGILAEISLQDTITSPDGATLKVGVSILNYGQTPFTFSTGNISLTPQDSVPLALISSEPSLPKEVNPGSTETFFFTFPRPSVPIATLKIFTVEYDIEGY